MNWKTRLTIPLTVLICVISTGRIFAQTDGAAPELVTEAADIQSIIDAGRNGNQVQQHLDYLTNRIGPRLTGSEGVQAACQWARDYFEEIGLEARVEKWGEFPVGFERGPSYGRMLEPKRMNLSFGTNAWTAGTKGKVAGRAVLSPKTMDELESIRKDLDGAYVLVERIPRQRRSRGRRAAKGKGEQKDEKTEKDKQADEERAKRIKRIEELRKVREELMKCSPAGLIQSTRDNLIRTGGNYRVDYDNLPTIPVVNLLKEHYDEIKQKIEAGDDVKLAFDIRNHFRRGPIPLYNVIADIPGAEWPEQRVVVGGHIDSWDGATGATDNASGCATAIEAARILMASGVKPRRTIRFMLWSGEEQGLLGSRAYVEKNKDDVQKNVSAVFVHDGGTNYVAGIRCTEGMKQDFEKIFAPAQRLDERTPFEISTIPTIRARGGSDHTSFIRAGVPGFFWMQRGRAVYRDTWHTQNDTFETVVPEYQKHSSIVIALGAYGTANLDHLLSREGVQPGR